MDTYGFIALAIGIVIFLVSRNRPGLRQFSTFVIGLGVGIIVAAVGSYLIVMNILQQ